MQSRQQKCQVVHSSLGLHRVDAASDCWYTRYVSVDGIHSLVVTISLNGDRRIGLVGLQIRVKERGSFTRCLKGRALLGIF